MDKEDGDYLEEFGKMINRLYPESPIGDYYIGYYYETGKDYKRALKYYKNGYVKISDDNPNKDGYYQNVERVLGAKEQAITDKAEDVLKRREEKEEKKEAKIKEAEERKEAKAKEREQKKNDE